MNKDDKFWHDLVSKLREADRFPHSTDEDPETHLAEYGELPYSDHEIEAMVRNVIASDWNHDGRDMGRLTTDDKRLSASLRGGHGNRVLHRWQRWIPARRVAAGLIVGIVSVVALLVIMSPQDAYIGHDQPNAPVLDSPCQTLEEPTSEFTVELVVVDENGCSVSTTRLPMTIENVVIDDEGSSREKRVRT